MSRRFASRPWRGTYDAIRVFALEHKGCGDLRGDAEPITPEGTQSG